MKFLLFISLICVLVMASKAAEERAFYKDPAHPGKCVVDGTILSPGEEFYPPSKCIRMICGKDSIVLSQSCPAEGTLAGFKLGNPIMPNEPYPKCCKKEVIPL